MWVSFNDKSIILKKLPVTQWAAYVQTFYNQANFRCAGLLRMQCLHDSPYTWIPIKRVPYCETSHGSLDHLAKDRGSQATAFKCQSASDQIAKSRRSIIHRRCPFTCNQAQDSSLSHLNVLPCRVPESMISCSVSCGSNMNSCVVCARMHVSVFVHAPLSCP